MITMDPSANAINYVALFDSKNSFFCNKSIKYIQCAVCLNILNNPVQCNLCDNLMCNLCVQVLSANNKKCFGKCKGTYKKANKFLREALNKLSIKCNICKTDMEHTSYYSNAHCKQCLPDVIAKEKSFTEIHLKDEAIDKLENNIKILSSKRRLYHRFNYKKLLEMSMDELRQTLMTFDLPIEKKMELYYACTSGKLAEFEILITKKKYSIMEEISFKNYFWTPLHYAMHYGQYEIIAFLLNLLREENILEPALRIQSNDLRCPMMCLLKSNHLCNNKKEEVFEKLLSEYHLTLSKEVKKEAVGRGLDKIIKKYSKV